MVAFCKILKWNLIKTKYKFKLGYAGYDDFASVRTIYSNRNIVLVIVYKTELNYNLVVPKNGQSHHNRPSRRWT